MLEDAQRIELESLGEFGLIDHLTKGLQSAHKSTVTGIGDDAAVLGEGAVKTVITTDFLAEGVHFDLSFHPLKHLGYKAAAVNFSDIYAMNGKPTQALVALSFSSRFSLQAVEELYSGIRLACEAYNVDIVGGDTSASGRGMNICITAIGEAREEDIVRRSGAKEHDLLCVSGDLGAAYLGLQLLEREKKVFLENPQMQPDLDGYDYILQRQLRPEARKDIVEKLRSAGVKPTSMIDVSDGLASEIFHLCRHSGTGMTIYETKLPIDPVTCRAAGDFNLDPTTCALNGGEDYELLFTISPGDFEKIREIDDISVIGHVVSKNEGIHLITKNDNKFALKAQGWQHF
jgi:thiamine-monophosphate kinase